MNTLRVITRQAAKKLNVIEDSYIQKVIKYIPTEIVAAYTAMRALIIPDMADPNKLPLPYGGEAQEHLWAIIFYGCLFLTPIVKYITLRDSSLKTPVFQIIVSVFAFGIWVFAFGDYFEIKIDGYSHILASICLIFFTLIIPLLEKIFVNKT